MFKARRKLKYHVWYAGFVAIGIAMAANPMAHVAASAGLFTFCIGYLRCFLVIFFDRMLLIILMFVQ